MEPIFMKNLKKKHTFDKIAGYIDTDQQKVKYPDRLTINKKSDPYYDSPTESKHFTNLPLPTTKSKEFKYYKQLHMNQRHHLKKELQAKEIPTISAIARNKLLYAQELNNLNNDKMRIENILSKGSLPYKTIDLIDKRREELKKLISI